MSTLKSSAEDLTLNADGSGNDVIIQSDGSTKAIITAEGKVGIGTSSPSAVLETKNTTDGTTLAFQATNDNDHEIVQIGAQGDGDGYLTVHGQGASTNIKALIHSDDDSYFNGGNVGIGTSSPALYTGAGVTIGSPLLTVLNSGNAVGGELILGRQTSAQTANLSWGSIAFVFGGHGTSARRVMSRISSVADYGAYGGDSGELRFYTNPSNDTEQERLRITADGIVTVNPSQAAIGTTPFVVKGAVNNTVGKFYHDNTSGNETMFTFYDGDNTACGSITIHTTNNTVAFNTSSDYRLKENVVPMSGSIDRLKELKPSRFNFITNPGNTMDGFLAHEVSDYVPEAIFGEKDAMTTEVLYTEDDELPEGKSVGDVKEPSVIDGQGIDQSKLVPLLTGALQEAVAKIEELTTRIETLENA